MSKVNIVTGAYSYTGRYITKLLQDKGEVVRNLTNHPSRPIPKNSVDRSKIDSFPLNVDNVDQLARVMEGGHTLYCTYWVRFNDYKDVTRQQAIQRASNIVEAAKKAGIQKIVYTSHTQTSIDSPLSYIQGKAQMEQIIRESGISYGFAKPCMIFGDSPNESIVVNNLAYVLRRIPIFPIPGEGRNPVQPVHVRDLAQLCVDLANNNKNLEKDAVGPELYSFEEFVRTVQNSVGSYNFIPKGFSTELAYNLTQPLDYLTKDKFIEKDDLDLILGNYLYSNEPPTGSRKLSEWLDNNKQDLGRRYISSTALYYEGGSNIFDNLKTA